MGSVVISVDAELGWGFHDHDPLPARRVDGAAAGWRTLLDRFDRYDLPATWAVVGRLFAGAGDAATPDGGSVTEARHTTLDPEGAGPSLVERVVEHERHEVACHSFGHRIFGDPALSRETLRRDLAAAVDVAAAHDVTFDSFVYPRNAVGHRDLLAEFDFAAYRGVGPLGRSGRGRLARKLAAVVDPDRVPLVEPRVDEYGLVDVPASLFLFGFEGLPRRALETVWTDPVVRQARHAVDRAAAGEGICHLWLHPNNVVGPADRRRVDAVLEHVAATRTATDLRVETMADVAARVR